MKERIERNEIFEGGRGGKKGEKKICMSVNVFGMIYVSYVCRKQTKPFGRLAHLYILP